MLYADMNIIQMLFIYVINVCIYASSVYIYIINKNSCVSKKIHNYIVPIMVKISKIY